MGSAASPNAGRLKSLQARGDTRLLRLAVCLWLLMCGRPGYGTEITYIYDDAGRLAGVVDPSTDTALYTYDALGNVLAISRYPSWDLRVVNFAPGCGAVGTAVTIDGTGFSETAIVRFNGVAATIASAAATQIVTSVPGGAAAGAITVTIFENVAPGPKEFLVGCGEPVITSFTPGSGAAGDSVTITGTGFQPGSLSNRVEFRGQLSKVDSASTTSIVARVPPATSTGPISVTTALGTAVSAGNFSVTSP